MSILNLFRKKEQFSQFKLPDCQFEPTIYRVITNVSKSEIWYDNLIQAGCFELRNKYPLLIEGCNWEYKQVLMFKNSYPAINTEFHYVDPEWLAKEVTEWLIKNPVIMLRRGFIRTQHFILNNISCYNLGIKDREMYRQWFVNDISISLAQVMNSIDHADPLYTAIQDHLIKADPITLS